MSDKIIQFNSEHVAGLTRKLMQRAQEQRDAAESRASRLHRENVDLAQKAKQWRYVADLWQAISDNQDETVRILKNNVEQAQQMAHKYRTLLEEEKRLSNILNRQLDDEVAKNKQRMQRILELEGRIKRALEDQVNGEG